MQPRTMAKCWLVDSRAQELCVSGGSRPGLPVLNGHDLCGRKATLKLSLVDRQNHVFPGFGFGVCF